MPRYRPSELSDLNIRAKKRFSQNFLIDKNIIDKICQAASIKEGDPVVEIGPGPGALTEALLERGAHVTAIEKDVELASKLKASPNLTLFTDDALAFPLEKLPSPSKIVANLPYQITTPLLARFLPRYDQFESLTVMVQKEVGQRLTAPPASSDYSHLSLFARAYSTPTYCFTVKPGSFLPPPKVHSCVVHLKLHPFPFEFDPEEFFRFTRTGFGQKRKMLKGSLKERYGKDRVERGLIAAGLKLTARPGELSLEEFAHLYRQIS